MVTVEVHVQMYQFNRCTDQSTVAVRYAVETLMNFSLFSPSEKIRLYTKK